MKMQDDEPAESWFETRKQLQQTLEFAGEVSQRSISHTMTWLDELEDAGYSNKLFLAQNHLALLFSGELYKVGVPVLVAELDRFEPLVDCYFYPNGISPGQAQLFGCELVKGQPLSLTPKLRSLLELLAK